jgi:tetratricopeptide (TPR) repeat protein
VLLTGQHPVGNCRHTPADLVKAIVDAEPTRPSESVVGTQTDAELSIANAANRATTPEKLGRMLRGDLDTIITKALKKDPAERYPSVTALADDLRRYLKNETISARPDTLAYRAAKFVRRNRTAVALGTLAVITTLGGLVGTLIQASMARAQRDFAFRQVARSEALNEFHEFLVSDAGPSGKPFTVNELLRRAEHVVDRQHSSNDPNRVELMVSIGRQYLEQEEVSSSRRVLEEAYKLSRTLPDRSIRARAACTLAVALALSEEVSLAETRYQEGLRQIPEGPQFALDRVECLRSGSEVAQQTGDSQQGIARAQRAQQVLMHSRFDSDVLELDRWTDLASEYSLAGQDQEAVFAYEKAGALLSSLGRDDTQTAVTVFEGWAVELNQLGRPLDAERLFRRAIDISRTSPSEETVSPMVLNDYARTLRELGRLKAAADYAERAYAKAQHAGHQLVINQSLLERARIYNAQRNLSRAAAMLAEVEPRLRQSLPPGHYAFASLASEQAVAALTSGDVSAALKFADESVALDEAAVKAGGAGAFYLPMLLTRRSAIRLEAGHRIEAVADAVRALSLLQADAEPGVFSAYVGRAYLTLGRALQARGEGEEARAAFHSAAQHLEATLGSDHPEARSACLMAESRN